MRREILKNAERIDPDDVFKGLGSLMILDMFHIYGGRIYALWNYVCRGDVGKMIAIIRARQLGCLAGVDTQTLNRVIDNCNVYPDDPGTVIIDLDAVVKAVKGRLPNFNPETIAA